VYAGFEIVGQTGLIDPGLGLRFQLRWHRRGKFSLQRFFFLFGALHCLELTLQRFFFLGYPLNGSIRGVVLDAIHDCFLLHRLRAVIGQFGQFSLRSCCRTIICKSRLYLRLPDGLGLDSSARCKH